MKKRYEKWGIFRSGLLAGVVLCAGIGTAYAHHVIVETDYVVKNKDKPGVVVVDARAAGDYKRGSSPGRSSSVKRAERRNCGTWMRASCR